MRCLLISLTCQLSHAASFYCLPNLFCAVQRVQHIIIAAHTTLFKASKPTTNLSCRQARVAAAFFKPILIVNGIFFYKWNSLFYLSLSACHEILTHFVGRLSRFGNYTDTWTIDCMLRCMCQTEGLLSDVLFGKSPIYSASLNLKSINTITVEMRQHVHINIFGFYLQSIHRYVLIFTYLLIIYLSYRSHPYKFCGGEGRERTNIAVWFMKFSWVTWIWFRYRSN